MSPSRGKPMPIDPASRKKSSAKKPGSASKATPPSGRKPSNRDKMTPYGK
jgi:hypothetical protein